MFDVTTFLMRWLFLSNLARDAAEIQTLPYQPYFPSQQIHQEQQIQQQISHLPEPIQKLRAEESWRDHCVRGILSYPPGAQRLLAMDASRSELVEELSQTLRCFDKVLNRYVLVRRRHSQNQYHNTHNNGIDSKAGDNDRIGGDASESSMDGYDSDEDPFLDADVEIVRAFEQAAAGTDKEANDNDPGRSAEMKDDGTDDKRQATLVISKTGTNVLDSSDSTTTSTTEQSQDQPEQLVSELGTMPTDEEVQEASSGMRLTRDYLPQLVSAVLKSPPAFQVFQNQHEVVANPIHKLRHLILQRCRSDPSWGIELCWLLEAEVGRAWKTLFEHRQQTGRRLIVVLPAEKAIVLAKIGTEKREAFDLLQDAEQATAYGHTMEPAHLGIGEEYLETSLNGDGEGGSDANSARLPSSLSLRRCSHFGDTMHFIDRLTQISLDLRMVPVSQRHAVLQERLYDLNRRLRRRMATRGDVSIDVEDNRSPTEWPQIEDMSVEMVKNSIHFSLIPQTGAWPGGQAVPLSSQQGPPATIEVARALNIVVPDFGCWHHASVVHSWCTWS
jgi:hypothetical protein